MKYSVSYFIQSDNIIPEKNRLKFGQLQNK